MDFYTFDGAKKLAKGRKRVTCFWMPKGVSNLGQHKYCYDPKGTIKEYLKINRKYSEPLVFDGKGKQII